MIGADIEICGHTTPQYPVFFIRRILSWLMPTALAVTLFIPLTISIFQNAVRHLYKPVLISETLIEKVPYSGSTLSKI